MLPVTHQKISRNTECLGSGSKESYSQENTNSVLQNLSAKKTHWKLPQLIQVRHQQMEPTNWKRARQSTWFRLPN